MSFYVNNEAPQTTPPPKKKRGYLIEWGTTILHTCALTYHIKTKIQLQDGLTQLFTHTIKMQLTESITDTSDPP